MPGLRTFAGATLLASFAASSAHGEYFKQAPHIVFVLADDVGWNDVAYHGSPQFETPTIDALAANGVVLERYYATATCSPTRASIMSGRALIHHGIFVPFGSLDTASGLNLTYTLLSEHLQQQYGYTTAMVREPDFGFFWVPRPTTNKQ
jgi:arylsulfatase A-like enzyme